MNTATTINSDTHLYLVDGSGYIFRAYHALPPLTRRSDGLPIGAVSGFCNMLVKLMRDMETRSLPTHLAVMFDAGRTNFRNEIYADYKAHRPDPPEDLRPQFPLVREAVRAFGIPAIEHEMFEADDLIASYAVDAAQAGARVTIVSSDKDLMQLVDGSIEMVDTMRDKRFGTAEVLDKFGVPPEKVVDVQALAGDSSDNIPGVPGIGIKTAAELIETFGTLETLLARAGEIKQTKRRENLIEFAEQARMCRELVLLRRDAPREVSYSDMQITPPDAGALMGFLKAMEFTTLTKRLAEFYTLDVNDFAPAPSLAARAGFFENSAQAASNPGKAAVHHPLPDMPPIEADKYPAINDIDTLKDWVMRATAQGFVAVDTETDGLDTMQCNLVGISLALAAGEACYIPLAHRVSGGADTLILSSDAQNPRPSNIEQLPLENVIDILRPLFADSAVLKIFQNAKFDIEVFANHGIDTCVSIDDTMLMSYALGAGLGGHNMDALSMRYLEHKPISLVSLLGSGKGQKTFDEIPIDEAVAYAAEDADITLRLWYHLKAALVRQSAVSVYERLDRPLVSVIVAMERAGIKIDREILAKASHAFAEKMAIVEEQIHALAGNVFNVASPRQLGRILFEEMRVKGGKRTKTGAWGTGANILETIATQEDVPPIAAKLAKLTLEWRALAKLKSTYSDALPHFINPKTGRVHTSYALASTSTARLSSSEPNLQNIPIRSEDGRRIRTAFIAQPNNRLMSADYGQIELRLLAHVADMPVLKQVLADGGDIHAMTAAEVFDIAPSDMTAEIRRRAKAINFGIIYGISAFGLANQLNVSRHEADAYIKAYFQKFPGIRHYMEDTKQQARAQGYVSTIFGRRIHTPEIKSKNHARRAFAERAAINAPLQGSAADIIRRAMIAMPPALAQKGLQAQMLLQVHDELVFELPATETAALTDLVKDIMVNATLPSVKLSVPLVVDVHAAQNWDDAH